MKTQTFHPPDSRAADHPSRREFLGGLSAVVAAEALKVKSMAPAGTFGIAYTSFPIRSRQTAQAMASRGPAITAEKFLELCKSFGGAGGQMDIAQLASTEPDYLKRVRAALEKQELFLELSLGLRTLADADAFARAAGVARELGVSRLRVALLSGRRYEDFAELKKWQDFVARCRQVVEQAEPVLRRHKLLAGIENHKDWLADEQVEMLRRISSPHLGACVDFGNNLALLEDSLEVAEKLAPYVVTTHLKDMAINLYEDGFLLSEVALGDGFLPLARMVGVLRKQRPDVHFCLEMITRDPLKVPYLQDSYWATYEKRDPARVEKFKSVVLSRASAAPLPRITGLSAPEMLAREDENVRRSAAYAKKTLEL